MRETIAAALLAQLQTIATFQTVARRLFEPAMVTPALSPALFLVESGEVYSNVSPQNPPRRIVKYLALIYNNLGGADMTGVPAAPVNAALDALDALMASLADPMSGRITLGGLVYHLRIEGEILKAPGETTGLAMAAVPFEIIVP